jgi:predicted dehydrogenase
MIETAERRGVALGVDYVMRHQLAYCLLEALASSGQFGKLRTICFQNYAQAVPAGHWFWDVRRSGGILVEHGVHFFDAYGRLAGKPVCLWGASPKPEAVEVTIQYEDGAIGRYYHEFAFPREVERAASTVFFARGWVEIDGWIPTRLHGAVLAPPEPLWMEASALGIAMSVARNEVTHFEALFGDRQISYQAGIVAGLRDTIRRHRDPGHRMEVTPQEARASLALALAGQRAAESGTPVRLAA